jgi:hypothetical protein
MAWPRLAEYFARFKLSLAMICSVEVLAPTLSRVPLCVRPPSEANAGSKENVDLREDEKSWVDGLSRGLEASSTSHHQSGPAATQVPDPCDARLDIWKAAQLYLGRPVKITNVAQAIVPIQIEGSSNLGPGDNRPKLEVNVIVHGPDDDDCLSSGLHPTQNGDAQETSQSCSHFQGRNACGIALDWM